MVDELLLITRTITTLFESGCSGPCLAPEPRANNIFRELVHARRGYIFFNFTRMLRYTIESITAIEWRSSQPPSWPVFANLQHHAVLVPLEVH